LSRLRAEGFSEAQGFAIARPMPAADIPAFLNEWNANLRDVA
jgi:EAL domain-containing protein (putative c-di-GMP-specific phosphodiesterase class I)